jgi:Asp-tRNA(Asn)/Glu-tRNA(Gln) amidotransferase A subunit family amidase
MMMMKLAEATAGVDVYLAPPTPSIDTAVRNRAAAASADAAANRRNQTLRHFNMANSAGYPAVSVPNGFADSGSPTALTFYGRPFSEAELLALIKAYQDASGFHLKHPNLEAGVSLQQSAL